MLWLLNWCHYLTGVNNYTGQIENKHGRNELKKSTVKYLYLIGILSLFAMLIFREKIACTPLITICTTIQEV